VTPRAPARDGAGLEEKRKRCAFPLARAEPPLLMSPPRRPCLAPLGMQTAVAASRRARSLATGAQPPAERPCPPSPPPPPPPQPPLHSFLAVLERGGGLGALVEILKVSSPPRPPEQQVLCGLVCTATRDAAPALHDVRPSPHLPPFLRAAPPAAVATARQLCARSDIASAPTRATGARHPEVQQLVSAPPANPASTRRPHPLVIPRLLPPPVTPRLRPSTLPPPGPAPPAPPARPRQLSTRFEICPPPRARRWRRYQTDRLIFCPRCTRTISFLLGTPLPLRPRPSSPRPCAVDAQSCPFSIPLPAL